MWQSCSHLYLSCCTLYRYLDRIIRLSELEEFSALLSAHQKATTADGTLTKGVRGSGEVEERSWGGGRVLRGGWREGEGRGGLGGY